MVPLYETWSTLETKKTVTQDTVHVILDMVLRGKGKVKVHILQFVKAPDHYGKSDAIWDHTVLLGSGDFPSFIAAEAGTRFSSPGEMQS